jgi:hypothetical protein
MTTAISDNGITFADASNLNNAPPATIFRNLQLSANGLNGNINITADELFLSSTSNSTINRRAFSATINTATSGKNGLSIGTLAASTWYAVWAGFDGSNNCGWIDPSSSAPTVPTGITNYTRVGWIRTDSTANKYPLGFKQYGRSVQYVVAAGGNTTVLPQMASGAAGSTATPTYVAVGVSSFVPSTASRISVVVGSTTSGSLAYAAPNGAYGSVLSGTNPPPLVGQQSASTPSCATGWLNLESTNVYWACPSGGYLNCLGWEDNI